MEVPAYKIMVRNMNCIVLESESTNRMLIIMVILRIDDVTSGVVEHLPLS